VPQGVGEHQQGRALANMAKVFGARSFYVGVTRASHALCIYTNDKAMAAQAVTARQDKASAVEIIRHHERSKAINADRVADTVNSWVAGQRARVPINGVQVEGGQRHGGGMQR